MYSRLNIILFCVSTCIQTLPVPHSIENQAVFYVKTRQLNAFSCGYNCLFNACNLEQAMGIPNKYSDYSQFYPTCLAYLDMKRINPKAGSNIKIWEPLKNIFKLRPLFNLQQEDNHVKVSFLTGITVRHKHNATRSEIHNLLNQAKKKRQDDLLQWVDDYLSKGDTLPRIAHFICSVKSESRGHAILVSIVQNRTGRALFIFDNLNDEITDDSDIVNHLKFLISRFNIANFSEFKAENIRMFTAVNAGALKIVQDFGIWPTAPNEHKIKRYR